MATPETRVLQAGRAVVAGPEPPSVLVGTADGSGKIVVSTRPGEVPPAAGRESPEVSRSQIEKDWDRLAAEYRAALPQMTSVEEWRKTFDGR